MLYVGGLPHAVILPLSSLSRSACATREYATVARCRFCGYQVGGYWSMALQVSSLETLLFLVDPILV